MENRRKIIPNLNRRRALQGLAAMGILLPKTAIAQTGSALNAVELGLIPNSDEDQSAALQSTIDQAAKSGLPLFIPAGSYRVSNINLPSHIELAGMPGATVFRPAHPESILIASDQSNIKLRNLTLDGRRADNSSPDLLRFTKCNNLSLQGVAFKNGSENGAILEYCQGSIIGCHFSGFRLTALHLQNSTGMLVQGNHVEKCGNGGIRVWRYESGPDGTIVTNNHISAINFDSGNGQNGNGINVFRADEVIIANNNISECAFSAIRVNATNNSIIDGNICTRNQEVAIFSEFSFTGSIISNNIVDQAAQGISITNFDAGGRLAVCSGNIVRNIWPSSPTNPDTRPVGIFAEADTAISGNVVEMVPGVGILAGWGPFLRDVLIANNIVRDSDIGIAASVAEGAGHARISGNLISGAKRADIAAMRWTDIASTDLSAENDKFPSITVEGNSGE